MTLDMVLSGRYLTVSSIFVNMLILRLEPIILKKQILSLSCLSAGTGHIRFWSMARTFTGLKLQGSIGKFGNEELSDISGYADMPDGKVGY